MHILLVDDHGIVLDGIKSLLKNHKCIESVYLAENSQEAIKILSQKPVDLMLADMNIPSTKDGLELLDYVQKNHPNIKSLVLSMNGDLTTVQAALKIGAQGYMLKNTDKEELLYAIDQIYAGKSYFSKEISEVLLQSYIGQTNAASRQEAEPMQLTPREKDVLRLIMMEYTNKRIADQLHISEYTVESHRKNIFRKTNTKTLVGLMRYVIENNILPDTF